MTIIQVDSNPRQQGAVLAVLGGSIVDRDGACLLEVFSGYDLKGLGGLTPSL